MQLILLAAGKGSRLPKKLRDKPKCLIKISNKTLLEHNISFFKKFKYKTIITGFKSDKLNSFIKKNKFKKIKNKKYQETNMVYSLFKAKNIKSNTIVVSYGDIIFDNSLYYDLKKNNSGATILLKKNWLKVWKGRMSYKKIKNDAEDVKIKNGRLLSIGNKIKKKFPKYQFMGIIKLKKKNFYKLKKFFKKLKKPDIDFTSFLNTVIKFNIIKINILATNKFWYEIDSRKDIIFTKRNLW